ncbi:hypothetical protein [Kitasatospora sp. NBC_01300]|uniref:hypothetical protein n=1 Tax=Kitasatospora sp. NBC_01300 TaxID=2903574 RepID=UPI00352C2F29|nr:hypothetical protein OG556_24345 [Kitasatospora sp. NBC_01300]
MYEPCHLPTDHQRWFEAAYTDAPVVTQVNDGEASADPPDPSGCPTRPGARPVRELPR